MSNANLIFFLLIIFIYVLLLYRKRLYFATFYWLAIFTLTFLIPNMAPSLNTYGYYIDINTYEKLNFYYFLVLIFFIIFNFLFIALPIKGLNSKVSRLSYSRLSFVFKVYCIVSLFILALVGLDSFQLGTSKAIHGANPVVSFFTPIIVFGLILSSLIKYFYTYNQFQKKRSIFHILYSILFGVLFVFARRQVLYPIIIAIVFYLIVYGKKPKLSYLVLITISMIFIGLPLMISIRTNGFLIGIKNYFNILTGNKEILLSYLIMSTDVSWSYSLAAIIIQHDVRISLLTLLRPLTIIIPRSVWSSKPFPGSLELVRVLGLYDNPNMSIPPGIVGESYSYFGVNGIIIIGMLWGIATATIDHKLYIKDYDFKQKKSVMILSLIIICVQFIAGSLRGDTPTTLQETQLVVIPFLLLLCISKFKLSLK